MPDTAHINDPSRKKPVPARKNFLRPIWSAMRPETISNEPKRMEYAVTTQEMVAAESFGKLLCISKNATFTMDMSKVEM